MNVTEYLLAIGLGDDDLVGVLLLKGDEKHTAVQPALDAEAIVSAYGAAGFNAYIAPNPTAGPARFDDKKRGRGKEADTTRTVAVYADLDVKEGACPDIATAELIVDDLAGVLGTRPTVRIFSGGGLQPIWMLEDCDRETGARLLRRFGRLVRLVADTRNVKVDSVFDLARVLRAPGTLNRKYDPPAQALCVADDGAPMTPGELDERLDEQGVSEMPDDEGLGTDIVARPSDSLWATATCGYMTSLIAAWESEIVSDRHPWLLCQFVRLECARRYSCLTEADYLRAVSVLITRFTRECARPGDTRAVKRLEIKDVRIEAESRASRKTDAQLSKELGSTDGKGHSHSLDSMMAPSSSSAVIIEPEPEPNPVEPQDISEPVPGIIEAENNFWDRRDVLKEIYDYSLSRMCSPWAVLGACAAMALVWVRPGTTIPPLTGAREGSLNFYVTIAAGSGQGKSSAIGAAARLMPVKPFSTSVGSGEGMLESFAMRAEGNEKKIGTRESVLIEIDEFDLLQAISSRSGSSLISLLKTGFSGGKLSLTYANKKYPVLQDNSYRIAMIAAVQPGKAGWIFADQAGGFPQRFMWFPGNDGRISQDLYREMSYTMGLALPEASEFTYPREIIMPPEAREYVLDNRAQAGRGNFDAGLNAHAAFTRLKFAYALTVLDGRFAAITSDDWELSGIAAKVSDLTRDWVQQGVRAERVRDATEFGERQGTVRAVSEETRVQYNTERVGLVAGRMLRRLAEGAMTKREVVRFLGRDGVYYDAAITALQEDGSVVGGTEDRAGKARAVWLLA